MHTNHNLSFRLERSWQPQALILRIIRIVKVNSYEKKQNGEIPQKQVALIAYQGNKFCCLIPLIQNFFNRF